MPLRLHVLVLFLKAIRLRGCPQESVPLTFVFIFPIFLCCLLNSELRIKIGFCLQEHSFRKWIEMYSNWQQKWRPLGRITWSLHRPVDGGSSESQTLHFWYHPVPSYTWLGNLNKCVLSIAQILFWRSSSHPLCICLLLNPFSLAGWAYEDPCVELSVTAQTLLSASALLSPFPTIEKSFILKEHLSFPVYYSPVNLAFSWISAALSYRKHLKTCKKSFTVTSLRG